VNPRLQTTDFARQNRASLAAGIARATSGTDLLSVSIRYQNIDPAIIRISRGLRTMPMVFKDASNSKFK